jgi:hypothetical protein
MKIKQKTLYIVFGCYPMIAFAEVSDKIPSITSVLVVGVLIGCGMIFSGRYRWWLNVLLLPIPILLIAESISLWNETAMRESIIHEQGSIYFGALGMQGVLMLSGAIIGIVFGYKRSKNKQP